MPISGFTVCRNVLLQAYCALVGAYDSSYVVMEFLLVCDYRDYALCRFAINMM